VPTDLIKVERVDPCRTVNPSVTSYVVTGETIEEQPRTVQFTTINDLKASLCSRAKQTERYVWIGWRDGRFQSKDIVTVTLDDSKLSPDDQPAA
jgi:hypothetical protein